MKLLTALLTLVAWSASAASNHYIRPGAGGSNNGTDWNNAYTSIPASLTRGDTYYLADGSYGNHTWGDVVSGSTIITVKKATPSDHGTDTGWSDSYGAGQAAFVAWYFDYSGNSGYYLFDGYSASQSRSCGIQLNMPMAANFYTESCGCVIFGGGGSGSFPYCTFRYLELNGPYGTGGYTSSVYRTGFFFDQNNGVIDTSHSTVSHCWFHNGITTPVGSDAGNDYCTVEYCEMMDMRDSGAKDHADGWVVASDNCTFRYNYLHNYSPECIFVIGGKSVSGMQVYGNIVDGTGLISHFIASNTGAHLTNWKVYNNTLIGLDVVWNINGSSSGGQDYNQLYCGNSGTGGSGWTSQHDITVNSSAFVNFAGADYHLASATADGTHLSSPYNQDMDGNTRGADGTWDIGAYEYGGTGNTNPPSISVQPASQTATTNTSLTVSVTATGGGTLAYQWQLGSTAISGATASSYSTNSATAATNSYAVVITNAYGSVTSSTATLAWTNGTSGGGSTGGVFYVNSATGNDGNAGTLAAPWQSFATSIPKLTNNSTLDCTGSWTLNSSDVTCSKTNITIRGNHAATLTIGTANTTGRLRFSGAATKFSGFTLLETGSYNVEGQAWIGITGNGSLVYDNEIKNAPGHSSGHDCVVFYVVASACVFSNNFFHDMRDDDLYRIWGIRNTVTSCTFSNCTNPNSGSGAHADIIQTWWTGDVTYSNVFERCYYVNCDQALWQLHGNSVNSPPDCHTGQEGYWVMRNNIINNCPSWPIVTTDQYRFYNNLVYKSGTGTGPTLIINDPAACAVNGKYYNNVLIACTIETGSSGSIATNANTSAGLSLGGTGDFTTTEAACKFVNAAAGDFHIQSGSSLIGRGLNLTADLSMSSVDYGGNTRPATGAWDLGPYEYSTNAVQAPISIQINSAVKFGSGARIN